MRGFDKLPQRGDKPEWRHNQDYWAEKDQIPGD
jgi:monooxygenase